MSPLKRISPNRWGMRLAATAALATAWIASFSYATERRPLPVLAEHACLTSLSPTVQTLEIRLNLLTDARNTSAEAVNLLSSVALPGRGFAPGEPTYESFADLMSSLGDRIFNEYIVRLRTDPSWAAAQQSFVSRGSHRSSEFGKFYNEPEFPALYTEFVSILQEYFSTLMVGYAVARSDFPLNKRMKIVDGGVGVGDTISVLRRFFPRARIVGFDNSKPLLQTTRQRFPNIRTVEGDFRAPLPFKSNDVDVFTLLFSMNQYLSLRQFLDGAREVFRSLKPGGWALVEYGPWNRDAGIRLPQFVRELEALGFEVEYPRLVFKTGSDNRYAPVFMRKPKVPR